MALNSVKVTLDVFQQQSIQIYFIIDQTSYWELNSAIRFLKTIPPPPTHTVQVALCPCDRANVLC